MMPDLGDYGIDLEMLRSMYDQWRDGAKKSYLERTYLNAPQSHGKLFSALVRQHLGVETEKRSNLSTRVAELEEEVSRLRAMLRQRGIDPGRARNDRNLDD